MTDASSDWIVLVLPLPRQAAAAELFRKLAQRFAVVCRRGGSVKAIDAAVSRALATKLRNAQHQQAFKAAALLLADLARQGWSIGLSRGVVRVKAPPPASDRVLEKERVQQQERVKREEQLRKPSVARFVKSMERRRVYRGQLVSIFSLMRDGRELAQKLDFAASLPCGSRRSVLSNAIDPYVQLVSDGRCQTTGLSLGDVWRYFRHTWTTPYESVPGRSMMFLVRDRGAPFEPVIGIGALSSPIVQLGHRDRWLGWDADRFLDAVIQAPSLKIARWLLAIVDAAIADIDVSDFIERASLSRAEIRKPTTETVTRLRAVAAQSATKHKTHARAQDLKTARTGDDRAFWAKRARSSLFTWRRSALLADLLEVRALLSEAFGGGKPSVHGLRKLVATPAGVRAVRFVVRKAKADRVGIAMADISVCGAVQPYNALLGGKLVALMAIGPEIVEAYQRRYADAESEIASAIAGRAIVRPSNLVFLGTTSLYGLGSSQYNRIRLPCDRLGGESGLELRYEELGQSEAFGSSHLSNATVEALADLTSHVRERKEVRNVFGEGVSPRMRKARHGLELLGFPANALLQHGRKRIIYGIQLAQNTREYLLGMAKTPKYLAPLRRVSEASSNIAQFWGERWLDARVEAVEVREGVRRHDLTCPVRHGARVVLPDQGEADTTVGSSR